MTKYLSACLLLLALGICAYAQQNQISGAFVLKEDAGNGYHRHNPGFKIEADYEVRPRWTIVSYGSILHSPKQDSGTGTSYFASTGMRYSFWEPRRWEAQGWNAFAEADFIVGALNTVKYRKTVAHFRTGLGVRVLDKRLLLEVSHLFQDMLPDAAKLLKEEGFSTAALHTTFNQLSAWDYDAQYWHPLNPESKWGAKASFRVQRNKFVANQAGERGRAWMVQTELGIYRAF